MLRLTIFGGSGLMIQPGEIRGQDEAKGKHDGNPKVKNARRLPALHGE